MALDPRRAKPVPRRQRPRSCVWWFLFGAILGSFGVGLYWMTQAPGQLPAPVAALPKTERPAPRQPSFQFEKILRETVVDSKDTGKPPPPPAPRPEPPPPPPPPVTPDAPAAGAADAPPPDAAPGTPAEAAAAKAKADAAAKAKADAAAKAKADAAGIYILQVGSFKSAQEAEAAKAKLAMRGIRTRVQTVTRPDGVVWHRVMTGHLDGKKAMETTRASLKKFGTDAVPVKIK